MSVGVSFYRLRTDPDRFQFFLTDEWEEYYFDGRPFTDGWKPPAVYSYMPRLREPDFWNLGLGGCGNAWAIRPEAFETAPELEVTIGAAGELLPLPYDGREFKLFNVTECIDALDRERTTWTSYDDGGEEDVDSPVFRLDRLGDSIFKVPENSASRIYFWEDGDWQTQFRAIVERNGLTGLEFEFLYSTNRK